MRRGNWLTLDDDWEFTLDAWTAPQIWHWTSTRQRSFYVAVSFILRALSVFLSRSPARHPISRWRSIPNTLGNRKREYQGWHTSVSHQESHAGTSARHISVWTTLSFLSGWEFEITRDTNWCNFAKIFSNSLYLYLKQIKRNCRIVFTN